MALTFVLNTAPLLKLGELLDRNMDAAAEKLAQETVDKAKSLAVVRTGYMRDHITQSQVGPLHYEVVSEAEYSGHIEWGSRGMAGRPFMTPAMEEAKQKLPEVMAEALSASVKEAGG